MFFILTLKLLIKLKRRNFVFVLFKLKFYNLYLAEKQPFLRVLLFYNITKLIYTNQLFLTAVFMQSCLSFSFSFLETILQNVSKNKTCQNAIDKNRYISFHLILDFDKCFSYELYSVWNESKIRLKPLFDAFNGLFDSSLHSGSVDYF